jgi:alpha-tubulin suppressor-like RCC1 family protein
LKQNKEILFGWGDNEFGQLGIEGFEEVRRVEVPVKV